MFETCADIVMIGPVRAGKSTVGRLLAQRFGVPQVFLDKERWRYYQEISYDEALAREIRTRGGFLPLVLYWNPFDPYASRGSCPSATTVSRLRRGHLLERRGAGPGETGVGPLSECGPAPPLAGRGGIGAHSGRTRSRAAL